MPQNVFDSQVIELTSEIPGSGSVCFDPENVLLEGSYSDQLSAYRAKKAWIEALERCFLLDVSHDFHVRVASSYTDSKFVLKCEFTTACARYAFWRLTNQQAPEAQYIIETGHIPRGESRHEDFLEVQDLKPIEEYDPLVLRGGDSENRQNRSVKYWISKLMERLS